MIWIKEDDVYMNMRQQPNDKINNKKLIEWKKMPGIVIWDTNQSKQVPERVNINEIKCPVRYVIRQPIDKINLKKKKHFNVYQVYLYETTTHRQQ